MLIRDTHLAEVLAPLEVVPRVGRLAAAKPEAAPALAGHAGPVPVAAITGVRRGRGVGGVALRGDPRHGPAQGEVVPRRGLPARPPLLQRPGPPVQRAQRPAPAVGVVPREGIHPPVVREGDEEEGGLVVRGVHVGQVDRHAGGEVGGRGVPEGGVGRVRGGGLDAGVLHRGGVEEEGPPGHRRGEGGQEAGQEADGREGDGRAGRPAEGTAGGAT